VPLVLPVVLALIGLVALLLAVALLPHRGNVNSPPAVHFSVTSDVPVGLVSYYVERESANRSRITVKSDVFSGGLTKKPSAPASFLVFLPRGSRPVDCPSASCVHVASSYSWLQRVSYSTDSLDAQISFEVQGADFGYMANGVNAAVALPEFSYDGPESPNLEVQMHVDMGHASRYDWQSLPASYVRDGNAVWDAHLVDGRSESRNAIGIDHAAAEGDDRRTFVAGAVVGVAGGALIGALQEALHLLPTRRRASA
jgi:hypothetical protein